MEGAFGLMSKMVKIKHVSGMEIKVRNEGAELSEADRAFIAGFEDTIFCNDLTGKLWMFDRKMPSGRWLENTYPANDLRTATALVF
jgi:hypothetical protein